MRARRKTRFHFYSAPSLAPRARAYYNAATTYPLACTRYIQQRDQGTPTTRVGAFPEPIPLPSSSNTHAYRRATADRKFRRKPRTSTHVLRHVGRNNCACAQQKGRWRDFNTPGKSLNRRSRGQLFRSIGYQFFLRVFPLMSNL